MTMQSQFNLDGRDRLASVQIAIRFGSIGISRLGEKRSAANLQEWGGRKAIDEARKTLRALAASSPRDARRLGLGRADEFAARISL